jgi:transcriptional regulator with XRE-family HTH domain
MAKIDARTPAALTVKQEIKRNVLREWETAKAVRGLSQAELAAELGTSQENVSRLLNKSDGYWWTEARLRIVANFIGVSIGSLIPGDVHRYFPSVGNRTMPDDLALEQCRIYVKHFYRENEISIDAEAAEKLAARLCTRMGTKVDDAVLARGQLQRMIFEMAGQGHAVR